MRFDPFYRKRKKEASEHVKETISLLYNGGDITSRMEFENELARAWREFLGQYNDLNVFENTGFRKRDAAVRKFHALGELQLAMGGNTAGMCTHLVAYYMFAIHIRDNTLTREIAESLGPLMFKGWRRLGLRPPDQNLN